MFNFQLDSVFGKLKLVNLTVTAKPAILNQGITSSEWVKYSKLISRTLADQKTWYEVNEVMTFWSGKLADASMRKGISRWKGKFR